MIEEDSGMSSAVPSDHEPLWVAQMPRHEDTTKIIRRVLIANRGEIACRVISTCRKLNIKSIAIYVDEDSASRHITDADEAINLGSVDQPGGNPFLNVKLLVETALKVGADAVHPGYGYLSENATFADALNASGIIFIGPDSSAINTLGDKRQAKEYLSEHEPTIPLIPGYTGSGNGIQLSDLLEQSEKIGFPVMIKASAGGGGRGLRIVRDTSTLESEFKRAQSEALRSFGFGECIIEKYIEAGKHVEVQIMGDEHGNVVSLWERDCSIQRRHQKVVEESPCPWLSQKKRDAMCEVAVRIGKLIRYKGAGTVEFVLDISTGIFYFLEVNARLQVEHPITEECTGLDLVALQLFVASGGNLTNLPRLATIPQNGHAIECRLCAEDPNREFAPQHGTIQLWSTSPTTSGSFGCIRYETAISSGAKVSIHFDSMIAKIVVWAPTRQMAIQQMVSTLANTVCLGVTTNQLFLQACLLHPAFQRPDYTTSFIPSNIEGLLRNPHVAGSPIPEELLVIIPSLFLRHVDSAMGSSGYRTAVGTARRGFRNQRFDKTNRPTDIITIRDDKKDTKTAQLCVWQFDHAKDLNEATVEVAPVPQMDDRETTDGADVLASTRAYNKLSVGIRNDSLVGKRLCRTQVHTIRRELSQNKHQLDSWRTGRIEVSINGRRILASIATTSDYARLGDNRSGIPVLCHFPVIGSPIDFLCYSPLSYYESQRTVMAAGEEENTGIIKAPMPCKVLEVLKENGEKVKKGEIVMVIESMKMEITISASKDGIFELAVGKDDAVNEGSVLCRFC